MGRFRPKIVSNGPIDFFYEMILCICRNESDMSDPKRNQKKPLSTSSNSDNKIELHGKTTYTQISDGRITVKKNIRNCLNNKKIIFPLQKPKMSSHSSSNKPTISLKTDENTNLSNGLIRNQNKNLLSSNKDDEQVRKHLFKLCFKKFNNTFCSHIRL